MSAVVICVVIGVVIGAVESWNHTHTHARTHARTHVRTDSHTFFLGVEFETVERILFNCNILPKSSQKNTADSVSSNPSFQVQEDGPGFDSPTANYLSIPAYYSLQYKH